MEEDEWGCGLVYEEVTDETEIWIECGLCEQWYHCDCEVPPHQKLIIFVTNANSTV